MQTHTRTCFVRLLLSINNRKMCRKRGCNSPLQRVCEFEHMVDVEQDMRAGWRVPFGEISCTCAAPSVWGKPICTLTFLHVCYVF